ncbi:unnamed protein product [Trichobilharzia regenti]|nr:unnamed protein product [Trichobilharzia regenti]
MKRRLRMYCEAYWSEHVCGEESSVASGNSRKLFQVIRSTCNKKRGVVEATGRADGTLINKLERRLEPWAEHLDKQFSLSIVKVLNIINYGASWKVNTNSPKEMEI